MLRLLGTKQIMLHPNQKSFMLTHNVGFEKNRSMCYLEGPNKKAFLFKTQKEIGDLNSVRAVQIREAKHQSCGAMIYCCTTNCLRIGTFRRPPVLYSDYTLLQCDFPIVKWGFLQTHEYDLNQAWVVVTDHFSLLLYRMHYTKKTGRFAINLVDTLKIGETIEQLLVGKGEIASVTKNLIRKGFVF